MLNLKNIVKDIDVSIFGISLKVIAINNDKYYITWHARDYRGVLLPHRSRIYTVPNFLTYEYEIVDTIILNIEELVLNELRIVTPEDVVDDYEEDYSEGVNENSSY